MVAGRAVTGTFLIVSLAVMIGWRMMPALAGSIDGRVVRKVQGVGLQGIRIKLYDEKWRVLRSTVSGPSGGYTFADLPEGRYYVQAVGDTTYAGRFSGDADSRQDAVTVTVFGPEPTRFVDLPLRRWGSLSGRVVALQDRSPVAQAQIRLYDHGWRPQRSVRTDGSGGFKIDQLGGGRYFLLTWNDQGLVDVVHPGFPLQAGGWPPQGGEPVAVELDGDAGPIELALPPGGAIAGRVTRTTDGTPLERVTITVLTPSLDVVRETTSRATGTYSVSGLPEGQYHVRTYNTDGYVDVYQDGAPDTGSAKPVEVRPGLTREDVDFRLDVGGGVSGRIMGPGDAGLPDVEVLLYDEDWKVKGSGRTDKEGRYRVAGLAAGVYRLRTASGPETIDRCYGSELGCTGAQLTRVRRGMDTADVDVTLPPAGTLTGRVVNRSTGAGLRSVYISVFDPDWNFVCGDEVDLRGSFSIGKIPGGTYYVQASNSEGFGEVYYPDAKTRNGARSVAIVPGHDAAFIQLALEPQSGAP